MSGKTVQRKACDVILSVPPSKVQAALSSRSPDKYTVWARPFPVRMKAARKHSLVARQAPISCCAFAASDHVTAAPPISVIKSRRFMGTSNLERHSRCGGYRIGADQSGGIRNRPIIGPRAERERLEARSYMIEAERRKLGQYWFQDAGNLPNVFKTRRDVS